MSDCASHEMPEQTGDLPALARLTLSALLAWLIVTWAVIILIDFGNIFSSQTWAIDHLHPLPFVWYQIYSEAQWTERLQWLCLALGFAICVRQHLKARANGRSRVYWATMLLALGLLLMLIEDSLNFRHVISDEYLARLHEGPLPRSWRLIWELTFYIILSALMGIGLALLWRAHSLTKPTKRLLMCSYGVYGLVGFGSAMRQVAEWQQRLGDFIIATTGVASRPAWRHAEDYLSHWADAVPAFELTLGFLLVDHLVEESIELIASSLLLAALLAAFSNIKLPKKRIGSATI